MAANTVNLDALIRRADFAAELTQTSAGGQPRQTLSLSDLASGGFFQNSLRKPDFQRETTNWTRTKVVDLIRAFLDGDLIPAVILWARGDKIFVVDGAHRLSALIAWIRDDYGDREASNAFFGDGMAEEQREVADRTRNEIQKTIGTHAEFRGLVGQPVSDPTKARHLNAIGKNSIVIQWVTAATAKAAEESFFKINQAAQPIDPIERLILQTRLAPNSIAARCIARGGRGHKYWSDFPQKTQDEIESLGHEIYDILYKPPHSEPITSSDVPIAGMGYNRLLFAFFLVSLANRIPIPGSLRGKKLEPSLMADEDGLKTLEFLKQVRKFLRLVSTDHSGSLGFHPLIYYYTRSGVFMPNAFLASLIFAKKLDEHRKKDEFTKIRPHFEKYITKNKIFLTQIVTNRGSGPRSLDKITELYWEVFQCLCHQKTDSQIFKILTRDKDFPYLKRDDALTSPSNTTTNKRGAAKQSKSEAFIRETMKNLDSCSICNGAIHRNSITFDHRNRRQDGGGDQSKNLSPSHPYCNSGFKN